MHFAWFSSGVLMCGYCGMWHLGCGLALIPCRTYCIVLCFLLYILCVSAVFFCACHNILFSVAGVSSADVSSADVSSDGAFITSLHATVSGLMDYYCVLMS